MTIKETFDYLKNMKDFSDIKLICTKEIPNVYSGYYFKHDEKWCVRCCNKKPCEYAGLFEWYKIGYFPIIIGKEFVIDYINDTHIRLLSKKKLLDTWDIDIKRNITGKFKVINKS